MGYANNTRIRVRDLFAERDLGTYIASFTASVAIHDVCMISLAPEQPGPAHGIWRPWHGQPLFEPHEEDSSWIHFDTKQQIVHDGRGKGGSRVAPQMSAAGRAKLVVHAFE